MTQYRQSDLTKRADQFASLEYILLGDLRDLLEEPDDEVTSRWLVAVLETLVNTLPKEFALQETEGFMEEVLEQYPSWYRHVEKLKDEQQVLYDKLDEFLDRLKSASCYSVLAEQLRQDLRDWMLELNAYHRHERRLVQSAFNMDIGGGD